MKYYCIAIITMVMIGSMNFTYAADSGSVSIPNDSSFVNCCYNTFGLTEWTQDTCPNNSFEIFSKSDGPHIWYQCKYVYTKCEYLTQQDCNVKIANQPNQ